MIKRIQDTPQIIKSLAIAFGCLLELKDQIEDPIAEDITHDLKEIKLKLT